MFDFIREGFIELLDSEVDWMDQHTKSYAKKKAKAIKPYIGFNPHLFENMTYLNESVQKVSQMRVVFWGMLFSLPKDGRMMSFRLKHL